MNVRASVLVIDDERGLRDLLAYELSQEGFEVTTAENGMAAVEAVKRQRFDLAITDLKMPGMDGMQTLEALRQIDPDLEVIIATGYATVDTAVESLKRGAYDYIQKPYDLNDLKALLERAMEKSHLEGVVALYEASRALLGTLNSSDLIALVIGLARKVLNADEVALVLTSPQSIHRAGAEPCLADMTLLTIAESALTHGKLQRISRGESGCDEFTSAVAVPLDSRGRSLGVMVVARTTSVPFSTSEAQRGTIFASQIALALDNAELYKELEAKIEELVHTRQQLVQSEKLNLAGDLASSVAHEVNNPLAVVQANLDALRDYSSSIGSLWLAAKSAAGYLQDIADPKAAVLADQLLHPGGQVNTELLVRDLAEVVIDILDGTARIADLVGGFRHLSCQTDMESTGPTDMSTVIAECIASLRAESQRLDIHHVVPPGVMVQLSKDNLGAVMSSLLIYLTRPERKRVGDSGSINLAVTHDARFIRLSVIDTTLLLTPEEIHRFFDPRIEVDTTRGRTMRLNLCLALSYQLVQRHGGQMTLRPTTQGTQFDLVLPTGSAA